MREYTHQGTAYEHAIDVLEDEAGGSETCYETVELGDLQQGHGDGPRFDERSDYSNFIEKVCGNDPKNRNDDQSDGWGYFAGTPVDWTATEQKQQLPYRSLNNTYDNMSRVYNKRAQGDFSWTMSAKYEA
ncbi:hypothetical protein BJV82DRAFT_583648 [Fennellomyces sp. T-0311]|nr:hypothetical protein BJV82DRAFT_583648 [Fennellomyces sp. T-0311]